MLELLALLFVGSIVMFLSDMNKWKYQTEITFGVVILFLVVLAILKTKKPTHPNSDGY